MELDTAKGTRDISPSEQLLREDIIAKIQSVFARYGYVPLDTPILERKDVLLAKFAAGDDSDALQETYQLKDNGDRELGLRFDLTVPLSRYVGMNKNIKLPFKRYQIGKVYRDAPVRTGRYREFTQCDADIIGSSSLLADVTTLQVALDVFSAIGLDVKIKVNNRLFLQSLLSSYGIDDQKFETVVTSIDKLDKIGRDGVAKELVDKSIAQDSINKILDELQNNDLNYFLEKLCDAKGMDDLKRMFELLNDERIIFDPTIVRGLAYYTSTVFEIFDATGTFDSSIGGGGRYDELIGSYLEASNQKTDKSFSAVGISFGLDRIIDVIKQTNKFAEKKSLTQLYIVPLNTQDQSYKIAQQFRNENINTDIDLMGRGLSKNMQYANDQQIPFVAIIGEDELNNNVISLKNLSSGEEQKISVQEAIGIIKSSL